MSESIAEARKNEAYYKLTTEEPEKFYIQISNKNGKEKQSKYINFIWFLWKLKDLGLSINDFASISDIPITSINNWKNSTLCPTWAGSILTLYEKTLPKELHALEKELKQEIAKAEELFKSIKERIINYKTEAEKI
ncbi:TPA: hypothetical protein SCW97_001718 [Campylobacter jejuni]|uniref:hypothetical protein n=1 Tax=Campylobacter TaxID=194 RepID=UPI000873654A|nr:hypothetical protein [Campylobacter sp. US12a]EAJ8747128.1 hypothetical protein [Campylobacter jejuni]EEU7470750.1 hypothetical protein [Campylobacter jejuni]MCW1356517.1 hypothetical protein [Campylobacter jejuni]OEV61797.1 hypothetical protein AJY73_10630 [Campylobacter jejuni]TEY03862.1 hypothetical protein ELQ15_08765 [Campylobacter sp. US12a]